MHIFQQRRVYQGMVLTAAAAAAALAISGPAQASATPNARGLSHVQGSAARKAGPLAISQCPQYSLCLWRDAGYDGTMWHWTNSASPKNTWISVNTEGNTGANDQASSLYNDRDDYSGVAKNYPATSPDGYFEVPGNQINNLAGLYWPDGTKENDSISSIDITNTP